MQRKPKARRKQPEDVSAGWSRMNRTGIQTSPLDSQEMIAGAAGERGGRDDGEALAVRKRYLEEGEPIGSMPPPGTVKGAARMVKDLLTGARGTVLIDRIAERLAFERSGTRLYDALLTKHAVLGSFDGGPSRADLQHIRNEEHQHFLMLHEVLEMLGADPTAVTPSADLSGVESRGVMEVVTDPRTTLPQALHAILVAELADWAGWDLLIGLVSELGQDELAERFGRAHEEEQEHLRKVRTWLTNHTSRLAAGK